MLYAVLLGSGVSRAAGVPTGWEVVEDLIRKIRAARDLPAGEDPADWFRREYGSDPDFSSLLTALSPGAADRAAILRGYFEPLDGERQTGDKKPTRAHPDAFIQREWAEMIVKGVETEIDRLPRIGLPPPPGSLKQWPTDPDQIARGHNLARQVNRIRPRRRGNPPKRP